MNTIYMMMDEKRHFALVKIGFTSNLESRIYQYTTHNPLIECISVVNTMEKSKRKVEKMFHEEVEKMGLEFVTAVIDGKTTEWFKVDYNSQLYTDIREKGLNAFKSGKSRKNLGTFVLVK